MKKKQKKDRQAGAREGKDRFAGLAEFIAAAALLLALVLLVMLIRSFGVADSAADETDGASNGQTEISNSGEATVYAPIRNDSAELPLEVESNVFLTALYSASGAYPEDATDEYAENVLCAEFRNNADAAVEYMTAFVMIDGVKYSFAATTIPAGETVRVFEKERSPAPANAEEVSVESEYLIFFEEEPSLHTDTLAFDCQNGTIVVKNIAEDDILSDIVVYYKTRIQDVYHGGITYRLRVSGGLKAGETFNGYAPHASDGNTRVMFVDYEE